MPQVVITLRIGPLCSAATARRPLVGFTPPFASVVAISARSRQSTRTEQCLK
jgi:hypothetical protein